LSDELKNALHALEQQLQAQQSNPASGNGGYKGRSEDQGEVVEGQFHEI
jgi:hypothetical protein